MPSTFSTGVYRHGKRYRFAVTAMDESREASKAAAAELVEQVRMFSEATAPKVRRQAFRKSKSR